MLECPWLPPSHEKAMALPSGENAGLDLTPGRLAKGNSWVAPSDARWGRRNQRIPLVNRISTAIAAITSGHRRCFEVAAPSLARGVLPLLSC